MQKGEREERRGWLGVQGSTERGPDPLSSHLDSIPLTTPSPRGGGGGNRVDSRDLAGDLVYWYLV